MKTFTQILALTLSATSAMAVTVNMWGGDDCDGNLDSFTIEGGGSNRCVPVPSAKRSISVENNGGCTVTTYSGNNCEGSTYQVNDDNCHSVLYASVYAAC